MKKNKLTDLQYDVIYNKATEPPFNNDYWNNKEKGIYVDRITGVPLFSSNDKYDSKSGWPSFTKPIELNNLKEKNDNSHNMIRTEVTTKNDTHLGHVFEDGPSETGLRYCINSAALIFIPYSQMEELGYKDYLYLFEENTEKAVFAGGCFWGMEEYFSRINGVINVKSGYTGGVLQNPTYEEVCSGKTGHAEAVLIKYEPKVISYEKLLLHFFKVHNPTTLNRQGADTGTQYRSAIFYINDIQKDNALKIIQKLQSNYSNKIVTELVKFSEFYDAEEYHQKYLKKNPNGYCHIDLNAINEF